MKTEIHLANSRGNADLGWLKTYHTFSFATYYDPKRVQFGQLRVLNDDWIAPGKGFDFHPHDNMEIITIVLKGSISHRDSLGNEFVISSGEIQRMSAGTGIVHSEYNASDSEDLNLLQIWIFPKIRNIKPSYFQKKFDHMGRLNKFQLIISPDERDGSIGINQNSFFGLCDLNKGNTINYKVNMAGNGIYLFLISGSIKISEKILNSRDGLEISETSEISFTAQKDSSILLMEVPLK